jgi:hypothetical protein
VFFRSQDDIPAMWFAVSSLPRRAKPLSFIVMGTPTA